MFRRWLSKITATDIIMAGLATGIITLIDRHFIHEPITIFIFSWISFILIPIGIAVAFFERD